MIYNYVPPGLFGTFLILDELDYEDEEYHTQESKYKELYCTLYDLVNRSTKEKAIIIQKTIRLWGKNIFSTLFGKCQVDIKSNKTINDFQKWKGLFAEIFLSHGGDQLHLDYIENQIKINCK